MTDARLVGKKLAFIETCLRELRALGKPDMIAHDVKEERFVAHTLQIAIQAALDVASHIVSDERLGEPNTNRQLFELLERAGWIDAHDLPDLCAMVGFRNTIVHGYTAVDVAIVRDVLENHLDDLDGFVERIRRQLFGEPKQ